MYRPGAKLGADWAEAEGADKTNKESIARKNAAHLMTAPFIPEEKRGSAKRGSAKRGSAKRGSAKRGSAV